MTTTADAVKTFEGTYATDPIHSVFGFSVLHNGISAFRGTLDDVNATLTADDGEVSLEGAAKVESISIREPEQFRAHVLGEEFFDAANHPEVRFRSTSVELGDDGSASVEGELTIAGTTRAVSAAGSYTGPIDGPDGNQRGALELEAKFDRREYGFEWNMELPGGGNVLDWDVTLEIHLELVRASDTAGEEA
jgi:polyisoprenoid-binding protein YceI